MSALAGLVKLLWSLTATGAIVSATISAAGSGYNPDDGATRLITTVNTLQVPDDVAAFVATAPKVLTPFDCAISRLSVEFGNFSIDLSRDELDVTTLPCSVSEACGKELASFRKTQAGFATATGSLEVYFTCDNESIQNKILQGSLQRTQGGATVRLYVCTKTDAQGEIDVDSSLFIEADIQLLGMSFSVNPDDPTTATINFGVTNVSSAFGLS